MYGDTEDEPALQALHDARPGAEAMKPALQETHVLWFVAKSATLAEPAGHALHPEMVEPGTRPYVPCGQLKQLEFVVLPTALL